MTSARIRFPSWVALLIGLRDRWKCHICGLGYLPDNPWELEHDRSIAKGGKNSYQNLRLAHRTCNRVKSDS